MIRFGAKEDVVLSAGSRILSGIRFMTDPIPVQLLRNYTQEFPPCLEKDIKAP